MGQLDRRAPTRRPVFSRPASYNAGMGNLLKAQKKATKAAGWPVNDYKPLIPFLELVTGRDNARETVGYVRKIYEYYGELVL